MNDETTRLERRLTLLKTQGYFPETPSIAGEVRRRLATDPVPRPRPWSQPLRMPRFTARIGYGLVAVLAVILLAALAIPETREVVADRLGLRGIRVVHVPDAGFQPQRLDPRPSLGTPVVLEDAAQRTTYPILLPGLAELGTPDEVFINPSIANHEVSLVYGPRTAFPEVVDGIGLLVSETPGRAVGEAYEKGLGPGTSIELVDVGGQRGLWLSGAPHRLTYIEPSGRGRISESRLAANVLAFERSGVIVRIEGAMDRDTALRVAVSLR